MPLRMRRRDVLELGYDVRAMSPSRAVVMGVVARQAIDKRVDQFLLKGSGDLPVGDHFRLGFSEATGLSMQAQQARRVKTRWSQNSSDRGRHQIDSGEGLAPGSEV